MQLQKGKSQNIFKYSSCPTVKNTLPPAAHWQHHRLVEPAPQKKSNMTVYFYASTTKITLLQYKNYTSSYNLKQSQILSQKLVKGWSCPQTLIQGHMSFFTPTVLGNSLARGIWSQIMVFTGRAGSSPEATAAEGGGPASPPLFWLMVVGSVWVDDGWSWSSLGRRSYTDSVIKDEQDNID